MKKQFQITGSQFAMISVIFGAMGSHILEDFLEPHELEIFDVGVRYMLYHALALILFSFINYANTSMQKAVYFIFTIGICLFSGSLFVLSFRSIISIPIQFVGPITPLGGTLLIVGWVVNIWGVLKSK